MNIDVQFESTEPARLKAIRGSATRLLQKIGQSDEERCVWSMSESLWPALSMPEYADKPLGRVALRLVPLSRIGQMEGKSGSLVLIGFFEDLDNVDRPHSHPVVIKTLSVESGDKLRDEFDNAHSIKLFAYDQKDNFAIPIAFDDEEEGYHVLWSLFSSSDPVWPIGGADPAGGTLHVEDLRKTLELGDNESARSILDATFRLMRNLHSRLGRSFTEERQYKEEYRWYLRGLEAKVWGAEWREEWTSGNPRRVEDAGGVFANPFWILEQVGEIRRPMRIGAIHGDLHPGNVVLSNNQPRIIDFGWARDGAHVAKDLVLLECNLRFHTVRPQLKQSDVYVLSDWVSWDAPFPEGLGDYAKGRAELIQHLRAVAANTLQMDGAEINWEWEYLVPLFLVALGLLRFAPHLGNQQAAVRFVLALATHIEQLLTGGE